MIEKVRNLITAFKDNNDKLDYITDQFDAISNYVQRIVSNECRMQRIQLTKDEMFIEDYQEQMMALDKRRREDHNIAIEACKALNFISEKKNLEPFFDGDINDRYQVTNFALDFVNEIYFHSQEKSYETYQDMVSGKKYIPSELGLKQFMYDKIEQIDVLNQKELDGIPTNYSGKVIVNFGTQDEPAKINKLSNADIIIKDKAYAKVMACKSVQMYDNSYAEIFGYSKPHITLHDHSMIDSFASIEVEAHDNSVVNSCDDSKVQLFDEAIANKRNCYNCEITYEENIKEQSDLAKDILEPKKEEYNDSEKNTDTKQSKLANALLENDDSKLADKIAEKINANDVKYNKDSNNEER